METSDQQNNVDLSQSADESPENLLKNQLKEQRDLILKQSNQIKQNLGEILSLQSHSCQLETQLQEVRKQCQKYQKEAHDRLILSEENLSKRQHYEILLRSTQQTLQNKMSHIENFTKQHQVEIQLKDQMINDLKKQLEKNQSEFTDKCAQIQQQLNGKINTIATDKQQLETDHKQLKEFNQILQAKYDDTVRNLQDQILLSKELTRNQEEQIQKLQYQVQMQDKQITNLVKNMKFELEKQQYYYENKVSDLTDQVERLNAGREQVRQEILNETGGFAKLLSDLKETQLQNHDLEIQMKKQQNQVLIYKQEIQNFIRIRNQDKLQIKTLSQRVQELEQLLNNDHEKQLELTSQQLAKKQQSQLLELEKINLNFKSVIEKQQSEIQKLSSLISDNKQMQLVQQKQKEIIRLNDKIRNLNDKLKDSEVVFASTRLQKQSPDRLRPKTLSQLSGVLQPIKLNNGG